MITRLMPFLALALAGAVIFGYIVPTYQNSIVATQKHIKSYEDALSAAKGFTQKEADLAQQRNSISQDNLARLESFLPDGVNNIQIIIDLSNLAAKSGMVLSNPNFDLSSVSSGSSDPNTLALQSSNPVDSLQGSFELTGTYAQFRAFMAGLEQSLRPLDVVTLGVTSGDGANYKYNVTVRLYWLHT